MDSQQNIPPTLRPDLDQATLTVVVPCFNEAEVLHMTHERLVGALGGQPYGLKIIYVDDGSRDQTWALISQIAGSDHRVTGVSLTRNFGHQAAVTAGLSVADGHMTAVMDADLQDPPEVVAEMIELWQQGYDVVNAVREKRKEPIWLRLSYALFYRIYRPIVDFDVPVDSGDFCLIDKRVLQALNALPEKNRFVRGLRSWVGFRSAEHRYERAQRAAGQTKYSLSRLLKLAFDGIFNFSFKPLSLLLAGGVFLFFLSVTLGALFALSRITGLELLGHSAAEVPGFTTLALIVLFFGSVHLLAIGILGEYLARIYQEVKERPTFLIGQVIGGDDGTV